MTMIRVRSSSGTRPVGALFQTITTALTHALLKQPLYLVSLRTKTFHWRVRSKPRFTDVDRVGAALRQRVGRLHHLSMKKISAGMAFSSLDRREFQPVLGYPRNEQGEIIDPATGNPTTERKLTKVVGLSEQSSRRFAPLAMLHYRLPFSRNIFASVGFTGKRDDYGVDLEYLIGPSVLYRNMFFTFGGYAGKQQKLAGNLFEGAKIEGEIPVRKDYKWGLGFSFTYKIPLGGKKPSQ
jgi:hypothetical protein